MSKVKFKTKEGAIREVGAVQWQKLYKHVKGNQLVEGEEQPEAKKKAAKAAKGGDE